MQSLILGIIQGLTEFLPISSSAHLAVLPRFFNWPDQGLAFDAVLHLGTLLAVMVYFWRQLVEVFLGKNKLLLKLIVLSSLASLIIVALLKSFIFRSPELIALNLIFWAIVLYLAERYHQGLNKIKSNTVKKSLLIGLAQGLAILPGVSRSGITISTGLLAGLSKKTAVEFSFLAGAPLIFLAGVSSLVDFFSAGNISPYTITNLDLILGLLMSFLSGLAAIFVLFKVMEKIGFKLFVWYRIVLGILILLWL